MGSRRRRPRRRRHCVRSLNAQRRGRARPRAKRDVMLIKRFCLGKRNCLLEVMADLQPYRLEPERVPNPEDSQSENEEVNDRLEGFLVFL